MDLIEKVIIFFLKQNEKDIFSNIKVTALNHISIHVSAICQKIYQTVEKSYEIEQE